MSKGPSPVTEDYQTPNADVYRSGVRLCEISFIVERETAQTNS